VFSEQQLILERARLAGAHPRDVVAWALDRFPADRRVVVTGLQAEGVAVADMAISLDPTVRVLTLDTGRLPQATHDYLDTLRDHWGRGIEVVHPEQSELEAFTREHGSNPFYSSVPLRLDCCHIRKVAPLRRALADVDCWLSGVRRGQSGWRADALNLEIDLRHDGIVKVNPVAAWSDQAVEGYLRDRGIPQHPLYERGYRSIGCAPCTRPVAAGEDARAGRWWWEDGVEKECGIHRAPRVVALTGIRSAMPAEVSA
jgi:phosphoadenylyl-sulfate reductase (thioredoxin)